MPVRAQAPVPYLWDVAKGLGYGGSYAVALDLFRRITAAHEDDPDYGPEHPDTLAARSNLARWTGEAGDPARARDLYAELLPVRGRVLGPEHPDTLSDRANLAYLAGEAGDAARVRDVFAELLRVLDRVLGPEHPDTLAARSNLDYWTSRTRQNG